MSKLMIALFVSAGLGFGGTAAAQIVYAPKAASSDVEGRLRGGEEGRRRAVQD